MPRLRVYPFVVGLYFVMLVFSRNLGEVYADDVVRSAGIVVAVVFLLQWILGALLRSPDKGALAAALMVAFVFLQPATERLAPGWLSGRFALLLIIQATIVAVIAISLFRYVKRWPTFNTAIGLGAAAMLAVTLVQIGSYGLADDGALLQPKLELQDVDIESFTPPPGPLPSIYFILTDSYTRADTLSDLFNYDNSQFLGALESRGFQVSAQSTTNYNYTRFVVPTILNYEYVAGEAGLIGSQRGGYRQQLRARTYNNKVAAVLASLGYDLVTVRTERSPVHSVRTAGADNLLLDDSGWIANEFETALLDTTFLPRVFSRFAANYSKKDQVEFVIDEVARQSTRSGPVFVVAHIMAPHHPFVHDRNGLHPVRSGQPFGRTGNLAEDVHGYADQVHYLNSLLTTMIDEILENSATPPIIILQGDHGLRVTWNWAENWAKSPEEQLESACLREVFTNLNAIYLPAQARVAVPDTLSPVNTFRFLLDNYFGGELGLLENRSFFTTEKLGEGVSFIDITADREHCSPAWEARFSAVSAQGARPSVLD